MRSSQERLIRHIESEGASKHVVEAFRSVPREEFVPPESRRSAYEDRPIGIPEDQTTSQPSLIARMIDAAEVGPGDRVLEIGTGYGFQTALLAHIAERVISIERHKALADAARENLRRAGIDNVDVSVGDGWLGRPEEGPYDAIVVSAAAVEVPQALAEQLGEGGRLVIPVTGPYGDDVYVFVKHEGRLTRERLLTPARFVPLVHGMPE